MVKPAAFLPSPKDGATSVFRHGSEPRYTLWRIAVDHAVGDRTLHGAAIIRAGHVRAASLDFTAIEPPPRHGSIVGWASFHADPEMQKAQRKEQAALIAQRAVLLRY